MLEPKRTARVIGILILLQGVVFLSFWKIASWALAIGIQRYSSFTGKMAKAFFSSDHSLLQLLLTGTSYLPIPLTLGITASVCGILIIAFPKQAVQILVALRVLKRS
ncbi:MAG: hypothetical protein FWF63_07540 [Fibromonadales bacterium]|nr:hypothetical protein [Fibromonadales bacterium]